MEKSLEELENQRVQMEMEKDTLYTQLQQEVGNSFPPPSTRQWVAGMFGSGNSLQAIESRVC